MYENNEFSLDDMILGRIHVYGNFFRLPILQVFTSFQPIIDQVNRLQFVHVRRKDPLIFLVPILYANEVSISQNFLSLFVATIAIVVVVKVTARLMKFDSNIWSVKNIWKGILGLNINHSTINTTSEKFVCESILITSLMYSLNNNNELLDLHMDFSRELILETHDQLIAAGLTLMLGKYHKETIMETNIPALQNLVGKAILAKRFKYKRYSTEEKIEKICLGNLILKSYKNISCIEYMKNAKKHIYLSILKHGHTNIAILKEHITDFWQVIVLSSHINEMHVKRFEQVIQYLTEAGVIDKWYKTVLIWNTDEKNVFKKLHIKKSDNYKNIIPQLFLIATAGYSLSLLILIGEILFVWF